MATSPRDAAFKNLSLKAQLHLELAEVHTDAEKLLVAIKRNIPSLVKFYLNAGVSADGERDANTLPIIMAIKEEKPLIMKLLLEADARPGVRNVQSGSTALHMILGNYGFALAHPAPSVSRANKLLEIAALLFNKGLSLSVTDASNKTPIDDFSSNLALGSRIYRQNNDEYRTRITAELPEKINSINLDNIRSVDVMAESPEIATALSPEERQAVLNYTSRFGYTTQDRPLRNLAEFHGFLIDSPAAAVRNPSQAAIWVQDERKSINGVQKNIIEGYLSFIFTTIEEQPSKANQLKMFNAMLTEQVSDSDTALFQSLDVWDSIAQVRALFTHPAPQNRSTSYPYFGAPLDETMIVYKDNNGKAAFEKKGLLSLSARNDATACPITKEATVNYLTKLIQEKITQLRHQAASTIQKAYRQHSTKVGLFAQSAMASDKSDSSVSLSPDSP